MSQATKEHWTQTPEGRKRMAEIARKAAQAPGAKKRMSELAKKSHAERAARQKNHPDAHNISEATRTLIAKRAASGGFGIQVQLANEYRVSATTIRSWMKRYGRRGASSNGLHASNKARTVAMQACGACRTCLLCQKLGAEPQWIMCLVANPLEPGGVA